MKKTDLLLVAGALIIAGGIWFFYSAGAEKGKGVEITVDGESKAFLPLGEDDSIITVFHPDKPLPVSDGPVPP